MRAYPTPRPRRRPETTGPRSRPGPPRGKSRTGCAYGQKDSPATAAQSAIRSRLVVVSPAMTTPNPHGLTQLRDALREFAAERDWDQYHSPKNLASALAVEAAELLERFQWLTEDQSRT